MRDEQLTQASHYLQMQRPERAKPILASLLQEDPDDVEALVLAGGAAVRTDDHNAARELLGRALQQQPDHTMALGFIYELHRDREEDAQAEAVLLQILKSNPEDAYWIAEYARFMLAHLHLEKAEALAAEALRLDPEEPRARYVAVFLATMRGDRAATEATLASLVRDDPESAQTATAVLAVLVHQRRYGEALPVAQELLRAFPHQQAFVDLVVELRTYTHWAAKPAWPLNRFGWAGALGCYVLGMATIRFLSASASPGVAGAFMVVYLLWVVHSWTHRSILRKWFRRRGV